jgi:hypothetical protein
MIQGKLPTKIIPGYARRVDHACRKAGIMTVGSVGHNPGIAPASHGAAQPKAETAGASIFPTKDTLVLSEKARDLAAQKAGKSAQEEATESVAVRLKEGDSD